MDSLHKWVIGGTLLALFLGQGADAQVVSFEQLNWIGSDTSTPNSNWGLAKLNFNGYSQDQFFNLNVNGKWVVQNMDIASLYGAGVNQTLKTAFNLGNSVGTAVGSLTYSFTITAGLAGMPSGPLTPAGVTSLNYEIGGIEGVDTGSPDSPPEPTPKPGVPVKSAKLPHIDKFENQVQQSKECAPGAVSNSLKYLQATGNISFIVPSDILVLRTILGTTSKGTPPSYMQTKSDYYAQYGIATQFVNGYDDADLDKVIYAVNAGLDVEVDLHGHAEVVAGVRKYSDGTVELDLFDDDQEDTEADPMHTSVITNGMLDDHKFNRFVIESAVPEPGSVAMLVAGVGTISFAFRRRKKRGA